MSSIENWMARLEAVEKKHEQLEHFCAIIAPVFWEKVRETIETEAATTQSLKLPVLFFLLDRRDIESLQSLDQFLGYLRKSSSKRSRREGNKLAGRLQKRIEYRHAAGALFEIEILTCLLERNPEGSVELYPQIRNRNFSEASIRLGEKTIYLEATILSQIEGQEKIWDIAYGKMNPTRKEMEDWGLHKVHHSSYISTVTGVSDPYNDALRITGKVEGKQRQLADGSPNILCIGLPDTDPNSLSVEWGINAIFSGDLKPAQSIIRHQKSRLSNDKNLSAIEIQKIENNIQGLKQWKQKFQAEPRLTSVLVFRWESSGFLPEEKFINPSPHPDSQLSEEEWRTILDWFGFS